MYACASECESGWWGYERNDVKSLEGFLMSQDNQWAKEMALMDAFEKTMCHDDLCMKKPQSKESKQQN